MIARVSEEGILPPFPRSQVRRAVRRWPAGAALPAGPGLHRAPRLPDRAAGRRAGRGRHDQDGWREPARDRLPLPRDRRRRRTFFPHANVTFAPLARDDDASAGAGGGAPACATTASDRAAARGGCGGRRSRRPGRRLARECARGGRSRERAFGASGSSASATRRAARPARACAGRACVEPAKERALLYYHQRPLHGYSLGPTVKHGGCPVLEGVKWARTCGCGTRRRRSARRDSATTRPTTRSARRRSPPRRRADGGSRCTSPPAALARAHGRAARQGARDAQFMPRPRVHGAARARAGRKTDANPARCSCGGRCQPGRRGPSGRAAPGGMAAPGPEPAPRPREAVVFI